MLTQSPIRTAPNATPDIARLRPVLAGVGTDQEPLKPSDGVGYTYIWDDLKTGRSKAIDFFCTDQHHYLVLKDVPSPSRGVPHEALEAMLRGTPQKCISVDRKISPSTVATHVSRSLNFMGISCRPSKVPFLLVLLTRLPTLPRLPGSFRVHAHQCDGDLLRVVRINRPDICLRERLSPSEYVVTRLLVEGKSYAEISFERRAAARTIANQIASVFRKLGASGRLELLGHLVEVSANEPIPPRRAGVSEKSPRAALAAE
jgi:DNA-binding CsgD family transcriptional regulator